MITRTDILAHLEYGVRTGFLTGQKDYNPVAIPFARVASSDGAFETYSDLGASPWPRQNGGQVGPQGLNAQNNAVVTGGLHEGGPTMIFGGNEHAIQVYNTPWDVAIGIYHTAIDDDKVGGVLEWANNAGRRFAEHKDYLCFNALTQGASLTSDYGNTFDQKALFSSTHTYPAGSEYTTSQTNVWTISLTPDNLETVEIGMGGLLDDRGQPISYTFDTLIVPVNYKRVAFNLSQNPNMYNTGNSELNPWNGTNVIVAPGGWLDSTSWYLASTNRSTKPLLIQNRMEPTLVTWDDMSQGLGIRYMKWMARYTVAYADWRAIAQGNT